MNNIIKNKITKSDTFDKATLSKVGDSVVLKYIDNSDTINVKEFDNTTLSNNN